MFTSVLILAMIMFSPDCNSRIHDGFVKRNLEEAMETDAYCLSGWAYYEKEKMCIRAQVGDHATWYNAKKQCRKMAGELVQIWTKEKEEFVEDILSNQSSIYWIGVSDLDRDGVFEYTNGSKVLSSSPGLGKWQNESLVVGSGYCAVMGVAGWRNEDCKVLHTYICEIDMKSDEVGPSGKWKEECTSNNCPCFKADWLRYNSGNKYLKAFKFRKTFSTSASICTRVGGRLLRVTDAQTEKYVRNLKSWWNPVAMFYWIGLNTLTGDVWKWDNVTKMNTSGYQNWFETHWTGRKSCAAVLWDYDAKWRITGCDSDNYFICEASSPCSSLPAIRINDGVKYKDNVTATVIHKHEVVMKCDLLGYRHLVKSVSIFCDWDKKKNDTSKGDKVVKKWVRIHRKMHGKQCTCESIHEDGAKDVTHININVLFGPRLSSGQLNNIVIYLKAGNHDAAVHYCFIANPAVKLINMTRNEEIVDVYTYETIINKLPLELHYNVFIALYHIGKRHAGSYCMFIGNNIGTPLKLCFDLKGKRGKEEEITSDDSLGFKVLLFILGLVTLLISTVMVLSLIGHDGADSEYGDESEDERLEISSDSISGLSSSNNHCACY